MGSTPTQWHNGAFVTRITAAHALVSRARSRTGWSEISSRMSAICPSTADGHRDIKVNVPVYKELFLELASGHVTIVTRVR